MALLLNISLIVASKICVAVGEPNLYDLTATNETGNVLAFHGIPGSAITGVNVGSTLYVTLNDTPFNQVIGSEKPEPSETPNTAVLTGSGTNTAEPSESAPTATESADNGQLLEEPETEAKQETEPVPENN